MSDFCEMAENVRRFEVSGVQTTSGLRLTALKSMRTDSTGTQDVKRQPHYAYGIEPIEYMRSRFTHEEFRGFLLGNILKYVSRYTRKDGLHDLEKARDYLERLISHERAAKKTL